MQPFMQYKQRRASELATSPFIQWLGSDNVDMDRKFDFMPAMVLFIMGFRDMNLWVIRFDEHADEHFRSIINGNTDEDQTHSLLFLEDWHKLQFDTKLGWSAADMLRWLFVSPELEIFRRMQVEFVRLTIDDGGDPMLRFAHSEAGEACGHVFFRTAVGPANQLTAATGVEYRYFGRHHLDRELGHVMESEGEFETQVLDTERRSATLALGQRMFDIFDEIFAAFHDYTQTYVESGQYPHPRDQHVPSRTPVMETVRIASRNGPSAEATALIHHLQARMSRAADHPFYHWLEDSPVPAADKLRSFLPLWVMDTLGYRDLNYYVFHYPQPANEAERWINAWVNNLETHSLLFFEDWDALGMDAFLGWSASETLAFCFLDPAMDVHRKNIFSFIKLGLRHQEPLLRFWLMHALESSGEAFFHSTARLAQQAQREGVGPLPYLRDDHEGSHPHDAAVQQAIRDSFLAMSLDERQLAVAMNLIDVVFDALEEQLALSHDAGLTHRFSERTATPETVA